MTTPREDDLLDRAVQALRQTNIPEGPPPERVTAAIALADPAGARRRFVKAVIRCAAAVLVFVLFWQVPAQLGLFHDSVAFADVVERLRHTHSVFFKSSAVIKGKPMVLKFTLAEPGLMRIHATEPVNNIFIFDENRSEGLLLLPAEKKALAMTSAGDLPRETKAMIDWFRTLRDRQQDSVDDLGPRRLNGKATFGFRVKKDDQDFDVWVDRKTRLVVRVERNVTVMDQKFEIVSEDFVFDGDLPRDIFSLTPPKGYTVAGKLDIAMPSADDLIYLLRLAAGLNSNTLPDTLEQETLDAIFARDPKAKTRPRDEDLGIAMKLTRALLFIHLRKSEGEWKYLGKGVKLGDAASVVCAWRKTGASRYQAVFGDLRVREVQAEALRDAGQGK